MLTVKKSISNLQLKPRNKTKPEKKPASEESFIRVLKPSQLSLALLIVTENGREAKEERRIFAKVRMHRLLKRTLFYLFSHNLQISNTTAVFFFFFLLCEQNYRVYVFFPNFLFSPFKFLV